MLQSLHPKRMSLILQCVLSRVFLVRQFEALHGKVKIREANPQRTSKDLG